MITEFSAALINCSIIIYYLGTFDSLTIFNVLSNNLIV